MSVAEIRTKISLDSKDTARALEELARSVRTFDNALGGTKNSFKSIDGAIKSTNTDIMTLTKSIAIAEGGLRSLERFGNLLGTIFKGAYDYTTVLESNAVGMSGILTSMTTLNGKTLEWNKAMSISKDIMKELRETALQTASTAPELIDTFRALLGPAMGTGMNVKQVMELTTVGVNAVKSMGLGGVQLVQELRSIIQGSIKPASSTLATALGISNADVKNAINSSEGLFKFLMKKLKGFEMSVGETTKTIRGRIDVLTEAFYQTVEKSSENVFGTIKQSLQNLTDIMLVFNNETKRFELNPVFIEQMQKVSNLVNDTLSGVSNMAGKLLQNVSGLTDSFVFFMKTEALIATFGMFVVLADKAKNAFALSTQAIKGAVDSLFGLFKTEKSIVDVENEFIAKIKERQKVTSDIESYNKKIYKGILDEINAQKKLNNLIQKQSELKKQNLSNMSKLYANGDVSALRDINTIINYGSKMGMSEAEIQKWISKFIADYQKGGRVHADAYMKAFKNGLRGFNISNEVKSLMGKDAAIFSNKDVFNLFSERTKFFKPEDIEQIKQYDKAFVQLSETMKKAGVSQSVITQEYVKANKEYIKSGGDVAKLTQVLSVEQMKSATKSLEDEIAKRKVVSALNALGSIATLTGMSYQMLTNDTESNVGVMAEWAIKAGTVVTAIGQMGVALKELGVILDITSKKEAILKMIQLGLASPSFLMGVAGITVAGIAYGAYSKYQTYQEKGINGLTYDEGSDVVREKTAEELAKTNFVYNDSPMEDMVNQEKQMLESARKAREKLFNPGGYADLKTSNGDTDSGGGRGAKRLQEQADKAKRSYNDLIASINVANAKFDTDSDSFAKKQAEINKQITQWQNKLDEAKSKGNFTEKEIENANNLIAKYRELAEAENERNKQKQWYADELQRINNFQAIGELTDREANVRRIGTLQQAIDLLKQELPLYQNNAEGRLRIETEIAEKIKAIREAELTDGTVHWDRVLEHIRNTSYNLTETINSGVSGMFDSIANFGQNLLTESKSLSQRFKDLFKSLANDLMNMMMKVIMRGLIMNAILDIGGKTSGKTSGKSDISLGSIYDIKLGGGISASGIGLKAKGGLASGWNIVGEQGPELVNFSNPARVYTAQQTRNALNASGGNVNIKIDLKNESGQELRAEQTGTTFDGENYVLGIVLEAISTNKGGIRNIMKGVATT